MLLDQFLHYLTVEKGLAEKTLEAYSHDLNRFLNHLQEKRVEDVLRVTKLDVRTFLLTLKARKLSNKTIVRNLVAIRTFFRFLTHEGKLESNPVENLESPQLAKTLPEILSVQEVEHLLETPRPQTPLGIRDRSMLEMLYATGMRVSELVSLQLNQLNLEEDMFSFSGRVRKRELFPSEPRRSSGLAITSKVRGKTCQKGRRVLFCFLIVPGGK